MASSTRAVAHRPLGRSGLAVAPLAFGADGFGGTVDEPTAFCLSETIIGRRFVWSGTRHLDEASMERLDRASR